jgi:hypothetical protein
MSDSMKELLDPIAATNSAIEDEKEAKAAKESDDAVKKTEAAAKVVALKEANDKLMISGPVAIRPTPECKGVTICKAGTAAPVVEVIPFADTVVVPEAKPVAVKPVAPAHVAPSHADTKPIVPAPVKPSGFVPSSHPKAAEPKPHGTHNPKSENYWENDKS